jgi:hypothetical protein
MSGANLVFCEGGDDEAVIKTLAKSLDLDLTIEPFNGKDNLRNFLRDLRTRPDVAQQRVRSLAVIRDADENPASAFVSVRDALTANGFAAPSKNGAVQDGNPRCGILIMPANRPGMLEDLCLESVANRPEFGCVDEYFRCIAARSTRTTFTSKSKIRVWIASHTDYRFYVGEAVKAGFFPLEHQGFEPLRTFLGAL